MVMYPSWGWMLIPPAFAMASSASDAGTLFCAGSVMRTMEIGPSDIIPVNPFTGSIVRALFTNW